VDLIACEDTRAFAQAASIHFGIRSLSRATNDFNEKRKKRRCWRCGIEKGLSVALISDAGTPAVSRSGLPAGTSLQGKGIAVVAIPGPPLPIAALSASGLPTNEFLFVGFLPVKERGAPGNL